MYFCCKTKKKDDFIDYHYATNKNTKSFIPDITFGKVLKVYDGDSITVAARLYEKAPLFKFSIRLFGIDTPELRSENKNEKIAAEFVQKYLNNVLLNKYITIDVISKDKYGRLLCKIYLEKSDTDISSWLLIKGYGLPYSGGKKTIPDNWLDIIKIKT